MGGDHRSGGSKRLRNWRSAMTPRKICVLSGSRAEYGLLYWLIKSISEDADLMLQLVVTGMHLSPEFGLTYQEIEREFPIDKKVEMLLSSDTPVGISKSMGLAQISFSEALEELKPDVLVVLGDRYEVFSAVAAATVLRIPVAHIHGGESTEGAMDEAFRHSITKMSHFHFVAMEEYRKRVIQLGENPNRVWTVGGLGIESIKKIKLLNREAFEDSIHFKLGRKNLLVTFHSVSLEEKSSQHQFSELLEALSSLEDTHIIFTKANSDTDGRVINEMIDSYVGEHPTTTVQFTSLGQLRYLSALQHVDAVVGNSSSGIIEAPSFNIGTVNIGDRQKGRIRAKSVIDVEPKSNEMLMAFNKIYAPDFQTTLRDLKNPYGDGCSSGLIHDLIKTVDLSDVLKKKFYDFA